MMKKKLLTLALLGSVSLTSMPLYAQTQSTETQVVVQKNPDDAQEKVQRTLWGAKISPYVRKVIVTLEEKKVPYDLKEILPTKLLVATKQEVPAMFSNISPFGKIPAYQETISYNDASKKDDSFGVSESSVIMEYIEQSVKEQPLRPVCPKANARVSWFSKYADDILAPITHKILFEKVVKPNVLKETTDEATVEKMLVEELPAVLDFLEKTLADDKRTWIANTKNLSLADIAIVSHLVTLKTANTDLEELIGGKRPHLLKYVQKILSRDSLKKALTMA